MKCDDVVLRKAIHESGFAEGSCSGHLGEIGKCLREIVSGHVGAGGIHIGWVNGGPAGAHGVQVGIEVLLAALALLAGDIDKDEGATGGEPGGAGMEELLLFVRIEMVNGVAGEDGIEGAIGSLHSVEHVLTMQGDVFETAEIAACLIEGGRREINAVVTGRGRGFEAGGEEAGIAAAQIDHGVAAAFPTLAQHVSDEGIDLPVEHVVLFGESIVEAPGGAEERGFVVGHGRSAFNHGRAGCFKSFAGIVETFWAIPVIKNLSQFPPMKASQSILFALVLTSFAACEKTPESQKAAEDAKKAGEAVKDAAKSGLEAAKKEAETSQEAAAKKAAELKEKAAEKAAELKVKAAEKAAQAAGAIEEAARKAKEALTPAK